MPDTRPLHSSRPGGMALGLAALGLIGANLLWRGAEMRLRHGGMTVFSPALPGCSIVVPAEPVASERSAAAILQDTLAKAAGRSAAEFPIWSEREHAPWRAIYVGATQRERQLGWSDRRSAPLDTRVEAAVIAGGLVLHAEHREAAAVGAGWWLEEKLGAHWFMPGPLGENIPKRAELVLAGASERGEPGFISRDLLVGGGVDREWFERNRLEGRFAHQHNMVNIFRPEDYQKTPEMAPLRNGKRYMPTGPGDYGLQPNFNSPAAVQHAAAAANRAFAANPHLLSFSLSINDSLRYDDSAETAAAVAPARFFRGRPDYSDLVFGFTNRVAAAVAQEHPDRYLPAYAYYWTENTPRFPMARNVVPFLTADRSDWFDPDFAAEDRSLVERWVRSGVQFVGAYDYYAGLHYLVPKPGFIGVTEGIPFLYQAGVRAFFAEGLANWALDGPKGWLAAELLWSPQRDPKELLEIYYQEFWVEAAGPMREFYAAAEAAWREQPKPAEWLKYYNDEHQALLFPASRRAAMRARLQEAQALAREPVVRARVEFVSAAFSVTERFAEFCEARNTLALLTRAPAPPADVVAAWRAYGAARTALLARHAEVRRTQPLAVNEEKLDLFLRNEPDGRAARALVQAGASDALAQAPDPDWAGRGQSPADIERIVTRGVQTLVDPEWSTLTKAYPVDKASTLDWTQEIVVWRGNGEPWEGRSIDITTRADASKSVRFEHCQTETVSQWVAARGGTLYLAEVKARGKVSPNQESFLIVSFLDEKQRPIGIGKVDRVPITQGEQETKLCVIVRAPLEARYIGFGVRVLNQAPGDFMEFSDASLKRLP